MNDLQRQTANKMTQRMLMLALMTLLAACSSLQLSAAPAQIVAGGDPQQGALAIENYGCGACHRIPGIVGAGSMAGPPLDEWASRRYIAGKLPNQPENLIQWIRFPQAIEPDSAMPNLGVSEQEARDISAYLFSLTGE
jgi:cytochrome c